MGQASLKELFPRLSSLSTQKDGMVAEVLGNIEFRRSLFVWEEDQLTAINGYMWGKNTTLSIKSAYSKWEEQQFTVNDGLILS